MTESDLRVFALRVTLLDVRPPVWRVVRVPGEVTLAVLHHILQVAMGWEDRHLHEWRVGDRVFSSGTEEDWGEGLESDSEVVLAEVAGADDALRYDYDMGDGWEHLVEVVAVERYVGTVPPVEVIDGARACPPEDCGGPPGYEHLLDALDDPDDEDHEELIEMFGDWFDPDEFDRFAVNRRLEAFWRPAS
jgi:hypothetical protein